MLPQVEYDNSNRLVLGSGFDSLTNQSIGRTHPDYTPAKPPEVSYVGGWTRTKIIYTTSATESDSFTAAALSFGGKYGGFQAAATVSASAAYSESRQLTSKRFTERLIITCEVEYPQTAIAPIALASPPKNTNDIHDFITSYGDCYVSGVTEGGFATIELEFSGLDENEATEVRRELTAAASYGTVSGQIATSTIERTNRLSRKRSLNLSGTIGGSIERLPQASAESIQQYIQDYPERLAKSGARVPLRYSLSPYPFRIPPLIARLRRVLEGCFITLCKVRRFLSSFRYVKSSPSTYRDVVDERLANDIANLERLDQELSDIIDRINMAALTDKPEDLLSQAAKIIDAANKTVSAFGPEPSPVRWIDIDVKANKHWQIYKTQPGESVRITGEGGWADPRYYHEWFGPNSRIYINGGEHEAENKVYDIGPNTLFEFSLWDGHFDDNVGHISWAVWRPVHR